MDKKHFYRVDSRSGACDDLPHGFREEIDRIAENFPVRIVDARVATITA